MRFIVAFILFTFGTLQAYSQESLDSFIKIETKKVESMLLKKGENYQLSTIQKGQLHELFTKKFERRTTILSEKHDKEETSRLLNDLDSEFQPKVAGFLTVDQRLAFQSTARKN